MTEKHFVLATAGHIDHGKSALVKALTGTDPDRLPEEKARGITIDLGFAELNLICPNREQFHIGIVDVPGHEDFVRNMIAGVGSIDLALLVVAADDGWMPQTEEHLQILTYLGIQRLVVAITKSDIGNVDAVSAQIHEQLSDTPFATAPIVPTSTRSGAGLENLKQTLMSEFARTPLPRDIGKPRLFVDRAFTLHGIGTVVTGTLTGGTLRTGQDVFVQPRNLRARIRSIQTHGREVQFSAAGMRTALNLPDLSLGCGPDSIKRGDVITDVDLGPASSVVGVVLNKSPRPNRGTSTARALKNRSSVYVHLGTTRTAAKVILLEQTQLQPGEHAIAKLRLECPILAFAGDNFVIRDPSEQFTIAGGTVLDPLEALDIERRPPQPVLLKARAAAPNDVAVYVQSEVARSGFMHGKGVLQRSNFSADEINAAVSKLSALGDIIVLNEIVADAGEWIRLRQTASALIDRSHQIHPERRGLDITTLRGGLPALDTEEFETLVSDLCAAGFHREGTIIARAAHRSTLSPELQSAADAIRQTLAEKPFDPPARKELAPDSRSQQALRFLIEQGEVIELNSDIAIGSHAAKRMQNTVVEFISKRGRATASELRQQIGTSRRVIIPFLEYLDRAGVTRRVGDQRELRHSQPSAVAPR